jgi:hypothetical protein
LLVAIIIVGRELILLSTIIILEARKVVELLRALIYTLSSTLVIVKSYSLSLSSI